jgi:hypothetical protein
LVRECTSYCLEKWDDPKKKKSQEEFDSYMYCCRLVCVLTEMGFLKFSTDPNLKPETDSRGFINTLKQSQYYTEVWDPIIESSTRRCYDDCNGYDGSYGYICDVVPDIIVPILKCSTKEHFLKCPEQHWDQSDYTKCAIVREYVQECSNGLHFVD